MLFNHNVKAHLLFSKQIVLLLRIDLSQKRFINQGSIAIYFDILLYIKIYLIKTN